MDSAPFEEWGSEVAAYFTWADSDATVKILTLLGFLLFVASVIAFFYTENRKLVHQANTLRAGGRHTHTEPGAISAAVDVARAERAGFETEGGTEPHAGPGTRPEV